MKSLLPIVAVLAVVASCASAQSEIVSTSSTTGSSVLVKVCHNSWGCSGNCTTYAVLAKHCFNHVPGEALEFACEEFPSCLEGEEFFGDSCSGGFGRNYTMPCNRCMEGEFMQCLNGQINAYDCHGSHTCGNLSECKLLFGPAPAGSCVHTKARGGIYNVSLTTSSTFSRCKEVRVDHFFNSNCSTAGAPSMAPGSHHHWTHAPAKGEVEVTMPPPPPSHHHKPISHYSFHVANGQCLPHEGSGMSFQLMCKPTGVEATYPEAPEEVLEILRAKSHAKKENAHKPKIGSAHQSEGKGPSHGNLAAKSHHTIGEGKSNHKEHPRPINGKMHKDGKMMHKV